MDKHTKHLHRPAGPMPPAGKLVTPKDVPHKRRTSAAKREQPPQEQRHETASQRAPYVPTELTDSMRPGAEDYRQHPSIINGIRRPYRRPSHIERRIP